MFLKLYTYLYNKLSFFSKCTRAKRPTQSIIINHQHDQEEIKISFMILGCWMVETEKWEVNILAFQASVVGFTTIFKVIIYYVFVKE